MEVDLAYVPRMEILSSMPSLKSNIVDQDGVVRSISKEHLKPLFEHTYNDLIDRIKWDEEIEMKEAFVKLEQAFYPFKQIPYYPFLEALKKAEELKKYVHFILIWGGE